MSNVQEKRLEIEMNLQEEQEKCSDVETRMGALRLDGERGFMLSEDGTESPMNFFPHAESQLLVKLRIPGDYFHRCPASLQATNLNYWVSVQADKEIFLRFYEADVRAIFGSRYKPDMDDIHLFPVVLDGLQTDPSVYLSSWKKEEDFTWLRAFFQDTKTEWQGRTYYAGVTVVNSEVGKSAVKIQPTLRGGLSGQKGVTFLDRSWEGVTSIRHITELDKDRIVNAVEKARRVATVGVKQLLDSATIIVQKPVAEVRALCDTSTVFTNRVLTMLENEYEHVEQTSKLAIAESVLQAVKDLPIFQRYQAEQEVGRYLSLFGSTEARFEAIADNLATLQ